MSTENPCKSSNIEPRTDLLVDTDKLPGPLGFLHAGTVAHVCSLENKHPGWCVCECGKRFPKIGG